MEDFPSILGGVSAKQFLTEYWQKKPLLIRGAIPNFLSPITGDELAGLSLEKDVESRLIFGEKKYASWVLKRGPFCEDTFKKLPKKYWTLLVQAVDLWSPEVKELIEYFYFLPKWRLEDIMISFSPEGGSVGPHFDNYDVFLLQGVGQREWQIGQLCNAETETLSDCSLSIIKDFRKEQGYLLNTGDMLYLPPKLAHWGIAIKDCITYSVGFRSPSIQEMLSDLTETLMERNHEIFYRDPPLTLDMATNTINPKFIYQIKLMLEELKNDDELLGDWFARFMTTPKFPELPEELKEKRLAKLGKENYINGEKRKK